MNKTSTLRRHLTLIRQVRPPYLFPTKNRLSDVLAEQGLSAVRARTIERDIQDIKNEYGITIAYNRCRKGYYLELPTDEDLSDFEEYVRLLERRERMEFLTQSIDTAHSISRYLQLERNDPVWGTEHLPVLWEALQSRRVISFTYHAYSQTAPRFCRVEPGFLFEYRNRWYLDGWDLEVRNVDKMRTFGLDRIHELYLTDQAITHDRSDQYRVYRQHAIGVTCPPDLEPERVVLRFTVQEGQYIASLPLHHSQKTLPQTEPGFTNFELFVILNHELEREILSYGETVEVLEPSELREMITERVKKMARKYI